MEEGQSGSVQIFPVLGEPATTVQPSDGPFDDPSLGQYHEALRPIRPLYNFDLETGRDCADRGGENRPLIGAIGEQLFEKRKAAEQSRKQQHTAVAILNAGRMNYGDEQQA